MVEIADIKNRDSLEAWLETQPRRTSVVVAHRAAMRILPDFWNRAVVSRTTTDETPTCLDVLRANLVSGLAIALPEPSIALEVRELAQSAHEKIITGENKSALNFVATDAVFENSDAIFANIAASATTDSIFFYGDTDVGWGMVRFDCQKHMEQPFLEGVALWDQQSKHSGEYWPSSIPQELWEDWAHHKNMLIKDNLDWSFWIRWYEAALNGTPLSWDMLEKIALIDPEDWKKGPAHVNPIIAVICEEYEGEPLTVSHEQILSRNASVIEAQLDVLVQLVTEEITRIRGANDVTEAEKEQIATRVSVLESIIEAVNKIRAALAGDMSTALTVIDEQLPQVFEAAEKLAEQDETIGISAPILSMGVTIKYLTDCKMPGVLASGVAAFEVVAKPIAGWFKKKT